MLIFLLEAAYRFYKTKCEEDSLKRKGADGAKKTARRHHERIVRVGVYCKDLPQNCV